MQDYNKALNYSYLLLKYRLRSRHEIIERLGKKNYPSSIIDKVLSSLENDNYINDEEFSRLFVSSCRAKGWGRKKIDYALKRLGVAENYRREALKDKQVFKEELKELIAKKLPRYKQGKNAYQRMIKYLAARGFDYSDIIKELENLDFTRFDNYSD